MHSRPFTFPQPNPAALYEDTSCRFELTDKEGWVNRSMITEDKVQSNQAHNLPLDCMWVIQVDPGWKVNLHF